MLHGSSLLPALSFTACVVSGGPELPKILSAAHHLENKKIARSITSRIINILANPCLTMVNVELSKIVC